MYGVSLLFAAIAAICIIPQNEAQLSPAVVNSVIVSYVDQYLRSLRRTGAIPDYTGSAPRSFRFQVTNMMMSGYSPLAPRSRVTSPSSNSYRWTLSNAWLTINGNWRTWRTRGLFRYRRRGTFTAYVRGIYLDTTIAVSGNTARITHYTCNVNIVNLSIRGRFTLILRRNKGKIEKRLKDQVNSMLCPRIRPIILSQVNNRLRRRG